MFPPNIQIKKLDPFSKRVTTIAGNGKAGFKDGAALVAQVCGTTVSLLNILFWLAICMTCASLVDLYVLFLEVKLFTKTRLKIQLYLAKY